MSNRPKGQFRFHLGRNSFNKAEALEMITQQALVRDLPVLTCDCSGKGFVGGVECVCCKGTGKDNKHPKLPCHKCNGDRGFVVVCQTCHGTGKVNLLEAVTQIEA